MKDNYKEEEDNSFVELTEENFYEDLDASIVAGYYEEEEEIEEYSDRTYYDNQEIDDHLDIYFRLFGLKDMDMIYLYFLSEKRQQDIKNITQKTQPAVSYDVSRIKKQMDFVINIISSFDEFIAFIIRPDNGLKKFERELLLVFFYSTSIVKTSKILGFGQISCRVKILRAIKRVKELGHEKMYELLDYIAKNLNKIKKSVSDE